jgi:hypothetical protein
MKDCDYNAFPPIVHPASGLLVIVTHIFFRPIKEICK